jgi:hypothetical protein
MLKRTPLTAALCVLAVAPAAAEATTYYRLDAVGTGSYVLDVDLSSERAIETSRVEATFA